jgi:hypothetical protein
MATFLFMMCLNQVFIQPYVIAAIVTGVVSIVLAIFNFIANKRSQKEIETLKSRLSDQNAERNARREYQFEARKRLYQQYEPLLFQMMEAADDAVHRIQSLARTARLGSLNEKGWLSEFNYYAKSTIYKLFVPLAIFRIMQKKLTLVDVTVDSSIGLRYELAKQLYLTYTDDFEFARLEPALNYAPNSEHWRELRESQPEIYWRQGLPMGLLDKTIDCLIQEKEGKESVISFGEFEKKIGVKGSAHQIDIQLSWDIFSRFHPKRRPVLWRILIAQSFILRILLGLKNLPSESIDRKIAKNLLDKCHETKNAKYYWKEQGDDETNAAFKTAFDYLNKRF